MIRELEIGNFKAFERETLEFSNLTLLSGLNGTGKSSILQSLLLIRQSYEKGYLPSQGIALNGDYVDIGTARDALYEGAENEEIWFRIKYSSHQKAEWRFAYLLNDPFYSQREVLDLTSDPAPDYTRNWSLLTDDFFYVQAERLGPRSVFDMSDYHVRQHRQLGTAGEYTVHFLSVYGDEKVPSDHRLHDKTASPSLKAQVTAWMGEVSPGTQLDIAAHREIDRVSLQYRFAIGRHVPNSYRSTNVGFGITYTLPVVVALLAARPGSLVLLENPEAHLHPMGQTKMGELMARAAAAGVQVVVETHSDHVLNGIRLAVRNGTLEPDFVRLHFVERPDTQVEGAIPSEVTSPNIDRDGRIDYWPKGFFDQWNLSLLALLDPRDGGHKE